MKKAIVNSKNKYKFSFEEIDKAINDIEGFYKEYELDSKDRIRICLMIEEALTKLRGIFGEESEFSLFVGKKMGVKCLEIRYSGTAINPFLDSDQDVELMGMLFRNVDTIPKWNYRNGVNVIHYVITKKSSALKSTLPILLAIVFSAFLGFFANRIFPELTEYILYNITGPIYSAMLRYVTSLSGPLVAVSVISGIYSLGNAADFSRISSKLLSRFVINTFALSTIISAAAFIFSDLSRGSGAKIEVHSLVTLILDIIPTDIISPLVSSNLLQIVFVSIVVGVAMLKLVPQTSNCGILVEELNGIVSFGIKAFIKLMTLFVFISIFNLTASNQLASMESGLKVFITTTLLEIVIYFSYILFISIKYRIPFGAILKALLPSTLITLTTASSVAAFDTSLNTLKSDFGVDERLSNLGFPLGQVLYMPGGLSYINASTIILAFSYCVSIDLQWVITVIIVVSLMIMAAPPIPGAALAIFSLLFMQLGIPSEAVAVAIALNVIMDFIYTSVSVETLLLELFNLANELDMVDKEKVEALRNRA